MMSVIRSAAARLPFVGDHVELMFGALIAFSFRCFGAAITFAMTIIVVRSLGPTQAGYFYLGMSMVMMLATIGNLGLEYALLRFSSAAAALGQWPTVRALAAAAFRRSGSVLALLSGGVALLSYLIAKYVFGDQALGPVFLTISPAIAFMGLALIAGYQLQALGRTKQAVTIFSIATPLLMALGALILPISTGAMMAQLYVFATGASLAAGLLFYMGASRRNPGRDTKFSPLNLYSIGGVFWSGIVANQLLMNNGHLIAGIFLIPQDVTVFAVAQRTAMLISFVLVAVNFVVAPRYSALKAAGDHLALGRTAVFAVRLSTLLCLPLVVIICAVPDRIMGLFSPGLGHGEVLIVLAIGQLLTAMGGTLGVVLDMAGFEHFHRRVIIGTTLTAVVLLVVLTPLFGVVGAAAAMTIGLSAQNIIQAMKVKREFGVSYMPSRFRRRVTTPPANGS